ncbi:hypothetical protein D6777_03150 [Candidatus Woesearchaeota archaeon]|nr:MAG: hypothetical protein D6777_03150 [Candidatus Woesearchaeota archaeon]
MLCEFLYGVNEKKKITAKQVRDAIIKCFSEAHELVITTQPEFAKTKKLTKKMKEEWARDFVKSIFRTRGADFEKPTVEDLVYVVEQLKSYASLFRSPAIIEKNAKQIMGLIKKIKD